MRSICIFLLCLAMLRSFNGLSVSAEPNQSCQMSHQLEKECAVYAYQVTKHMLGYFEQVTQKIDNHSEEIEKKNEQIKHLEESEMRLKKELDIKHEQIRQQGDSMMELQLENMNNKLKETGILEDLKQKMKELPKKICEYQNNELKEFKAKEIELQKELESKNEQIKQLQLEKESQKNNIRSCIAQKIDNHSVEITSKNDEIQHLKENEINLQRQIMNLETERKIYKSKEDSMTVVQEEMRKQFEQLSKSLSQKQYDEIENLKANISSVGKILAKCETETRSYKNEIVEKDKTINKQEGEIKNLKSQLEEKSCIGRVKSGVKSVTLSKGYSFEVLCNSDIAGPGWTVIQQRIRGGVDFHRDWNTYRNGFGDFWDGDFFLGLEKIHRLTTEQPHELFIHMTRFNGSTYYARYDEFAISSEENLYRLTTLGKFNGTTLDEFKKNKNNGFTTHDRDNDINSNHNNADFYQGGWWYAYSAHCNLNGRYYETATSGFHAIFWEDRDALKQVKMMIRPKQA